MTDVLFDNGEHLGGGPHVAALRLAWLERKPVRVVLDLHADIPLIVGRVHNVSVTGAAAVVDGWMVPTESVLDVNSPTTEEIARYSGLMRHLREGTSGCNYCRGRPVEEAAVWIDGTWRPPQSCPRCGRTAAMT